MDRRGSSGIEPDTPRSVRVGTMNGLGKLLLLLIVLLIGPVLALAGGAVRLGQDWRTADRSSAGIAPAPTEAPEAIVQVWAARAFNWRGLLAVHTWIATKPGNAPRYMVHQVIGWRGRGGGSVVVSSPDLPDRSWYGQPPQLVKELRGPAAANVIPKVLEAVEAYPYTHHYRLWPGPNSNTFTSFVVRRVPGLDVDLPVTAIGKDYLEDGRFLAQSPGGRGFQVSLFGLAGVLAGVQEGIEINLLGLVFGVDPLGPALKLPGIGRLGFGGPPT